MIRKSTKNADVTMSVCTGAFLLARTGLLSSKAATTFHSAFSDFEKQFRDHTAYVMEYQGQGWMNPNSNNIYAKVRTSTDGHPICSVCDMDVDTSTAPKSVYKDKTYYFCSRAHKEQLDATPEKFAGAPEQ